MVSKGRQRTGRSLHIVNIICSGSKDGPTRTGALEVSPHPQTTGGADTLSIPPFALPPPRCSKRESIHPSIWPNQVWIELTAVRQSLPALRLQICNLCRRLLRIFSSNINTGIVSYKYIKCHCWLASRYQLQPPRLDKPTSVERRKKMHLPMYFLIWSIHLYGSTKSLFSFITHDAAIAWCRLWKPVFCCVKSTLKLTVKRAGEGKGPRRGGPPACSASCLPNVIYDCWHPN